MLVLLLKLVYAKAYTRIVSKLAINPQINNQRENYKDTPQVDATIRWADAHCRSDAIFYRPALGTASSEMR